MKINQSKISHIVALVSIAIFIFVFYSFSNIANYIKYDYFSEILFLLFYVFSLVFISLYTLKNHLKIEFAVFLIFSLVISNVLVNEFFCFFSDLYCVFGQKAQYYICNALFILAEPYIDLVPSTIGAIVVHIAPIIPCVIWISFSNKKQQQ